MTERIILNEPPVQTGPDEKFRVQVGRFKERWYCDPHPADDHFGLTTANFPSVSTVKKASGADWTQVALKRVAQAAEANGAIDLSFSNLAKIDRDGLRAAGDRGTNVHAIAEQLLTGTPHHLPPNAPGMEYRETVEKFFADEKPTPVLVEYVTINRNLNGWGYGGTADLLAIINGKTLLVDWKSRAANAPHGARPEEAAQLAAYMSGDYIIDADGRWPMPHIDGAIIVSIRPDSYKVYPLDVPRSIEHWEALHRWWVERRTESATTGPAWRKKSTRPKPAVKESAPVMSVADQDALLAEINGTGPQQEYPTAADLRSTNPGPSFLRSPVAVTFPIIDTISEGELLEDRMYERMWADIQKLYDRFPQGGPDRAWIAGLIKDAQRANVSFMAKDFKTERRFELYRAVFNLAADPDRDRLLRPLVAQAYGSDLPLDTRFPAGQAVGALDDLQANKFANLVAELGSEPAPNLRASLLGETSQAA